MSELLSLHFVEVHDFNYEAMVKSIKQYTWRKDSLRYK